MRDCNVLWASNLGRGGCGDIFSGSCEQRVSIGCNSFEVGRWRLWYNVRMRVHEGLVRRGFLFRAL